LVDLLAEHNSSSSPYHFPVERQIHLLESYLATVAGAVSTA
jgi:hypothetical protein